MAKTLGNLQVGVRVYLDEANQADFLDTEVTRSINYAYHDVVKHVVDVYEDFYNTTTPIQLSTVDGQQEYSLGNANLLKIRRVEINLQPTNPNSVATRATAIKTEELPLNMASNALGGPGAFSVGYYVNGQVSSQIIGFTPVPKVTATNNISVWGIVTPSDLVNTSDTITIPYADSFGYLVELRASAILLRKSQQAENFAAQYMNEYKDGILEMKNFLKDRQSDGVWLVSDALYEDTVFDHAL